jgi:gliding motility-associated-like protein
MKNFHTMNIKMFRLIGLLLLMLWLTPVFSQPCDCVTTGNCPVPITDNGSFNGTLDVTVSGANDLGQCPLTSVCLSITHTWIGDLCISLTSPSGLHYILMADANNNYGGCGTQEDNAFICIGIGTGNPLTNNTEYMCNTGPCPSGTCCLTGNWTVACGGVTDPITAAQQAPNCNLNDFNIPGNPANGTWTLTVNDICSQDVGTLDNFSLNFACGTSSCIVCDADGGSLNSPNVTGCVGDPSLLLSLPPQYSGSPPSPAQYSYAYVVVQNGNIIAVSPTANLASQPPGNYQVCGLSYITTASGSISSLVGMNYNAAKAMLASATSPFCGDFSDNCISVTVAPAVQPTSVVATVCPGECIFVGGQQVCSSTQIVLDSYLGCDSVVNVILFVSPPVTSTDTLTVCQGQCVIVNGQSICPPGPVIVIFDDSQGCDSTVTYYFKQINPMAVITPANPAALTCSSPTVTLNGSSSTPAGVTYSWTGPGGFTSTMPSVTASAPGTYMLTVASNLVTPPCTSSTSVTVTGNLNGPSISISGSPPVICQGDTFDLSTLTIVDANNTNPVITYHSGTPATGANQLSNTNVSPAATTTYYVKATFGGCTDTEPVTLTVNAVPVASFTATSPICADSTTLVTFTGTADTSATFTWGFGSGVATPGTGAGPHTVKWATQGVKTIILNIEQNGCLAEPDTQTVQVDEPLDDPVVNCLPTTSSITFYWSPVAGATSHNAVSLVGPQGTMTSDTSYLVSGLNPGDLVTVFVEALSGNECPNSFYQITCTAQDCPPITVSIDPVAGICLDGNAAPFTLTANQTGGTGAGAFTWAGDGISNAITGTFNPNFANVGQNDVVVTYEEGSCQYNATIKIYVYEVPTPNFTVTSPICANAKSTLNYTGNADPTAATFTWNFGGGTATPGTGAGPHQVQWSTDGDYTVSLIVGENGCTSDMQSKTVTVQAPLASPDISCNSTTQNIEFTWAAVAGATGYTVSPATAVMTSDTSVIFSNLNPGDQVTVTVTAIGGAPCGNSTGTQTCTAQDCPPLTIDVEPVADICLDASVSAFDLKATVIGGSGGGTLTWSGDGIVDAQAGTFDPAQAQAGANTITALYEEGNCTYTQDLVVNVYPQPVASFAVQSPVCRGEVSTVTFTGTNDAGMTYTWNFGGGSTSPGTGQGPHNVTWATSGGKNVTLTVVSSNGCTSELFSASVQVDEPLVAPAINCSTTTSSINFSWQTVTGATNYNVTVLAGASGTQTSQTAYLVNGLTAGDSVSIELVVSGNTACPPVTVLQTCYALDCPGIAIDIEPVPNICLGEVPPQDVQLEANISGGTGTGTGTWSGPGITNPAMGIFSPAMAGAGQHVVKYAYKESNCNYEGTTTIAVNVEPVAVFSASSVICVSDEATVTYSGNASPGATFTWDFGSGTATPGTGAGPHQVAWATGGNHPVTLTVTENGCTSPPFQKSVQVDPELALPTIDCQPTTSSVEFSWADVPGATDYQVTVLSGQTGSQTSPNTWYFNSLLPGDSVTIEVTVSGNTSCPPVVAQATCAALDCPVLTIAIASVAPVCMDSAGGQVALLATVSGGSQTGTGNWSGTGVTDPAAGIFDPVMAGIGTHDVTYFYKEGNCDYAETTQIEVVEIPLADAGDDQTITCKVGEDIAILGGNANSSGNNITYQWSSASGTFPGNASLLHPEVSQPGTYTLTVTDATFGCSATDEVAVIASQDTLVPSVTIKPISCFGKNDGAIIVDSVGGGVEPYLYSLNGNPFTMSNSFPFLTPGLYELVIMDGAGCESKLTFDLQQPQELNVEMIVFVDGDNVIHLGDSVQLQAIITLPPDSLDVVQWEPKEILSCDTCLNTSAHPLQTTTFKVTVESNGCADSDEMTVFVKRERPVFVPSAFSPNGDGSNDTFTIFGSPAVARIKSLTVFDRWGETVFLYKDFEPNNPAKGWDGTYRGKKLDAGVFTWFAEIEFVDGASEIFEGGVTLMK